MSRPTMPSKQFRLAILLIVSLTFCGIIAAQDKADIPNAEAVKKSIGDVRSLFGGKYNEAKSARSISQRREALSKLAQEMLVTAKNTRDESDKYALLQVAQQIAVQARDAKVAISLIDTAGSSFKLDALAAKTSAMESIATEEAQLSRTEHLELANLVLTLIDEAQSADRYDLAKKLGAVATESAKQARDGTLIREVAKKNDSVGQIAAAFDKYEDSLDTLRDSADDPNANLTVGKFLCVIKGDWQKGLNHLALGDDDVLSKAATLDLKASARSPGADEQVAVGDAWADVEKESAGRNRSRGVVISGLVEA